VRFMTSSYLFCWLIVNRQIWRHIQPRGQTTAEVQFDLRAGCSVRARLEFDPDAAPSTTRSKHTPVDPGASPSRFSMSRRRLAAPPSPTGDDASD
jgi:hypothetical protein